MDLEQLRQHWQQIGETLSFSDKVSPTSRDPFLGRLEEDYILQYLNSDQKVLEVGCGDAAHTVGYAKRVKSICGLDVAESLIKLARERAPLAGADNTEFITASVLDVNHVAPDRPLDCVISQRCLINLPDWKRQQEGIIKIHEVLKPGGLFLMTEGFVEELDNLNRVRGLVNLPEIKVVSYNRNLLHHEFDPFIDEYFTVEAVHDYGFYLFLSRIYHPLAVVPEQPRHDSRLNEVAALLSRLVPTPDMKQFSYNLFYVLRKK